MLNALEVQRIRTVDSFKELEAPNGLEYYLYSTLYWRWMGMSQNFAMQRPCDPVDKTEPSGYVSVF